MKRWLNLFKETYRQFGEDQAQHLGAALAYYTIFSIAPLLLIAVAIAGFVLGRSAAQGQVMGQLSQTVGPSSARMLQDMILHAARPRAGTIATIIGVVMVLLGASGVFQQLKYSMNAIWNVPLQKSGIMATIKRDALSIAMVFGVGVLLLLSMVVESALHVMAKYAVGALPGGTVLWEIIQLVVSAAIITVLFAMIFRVLPDTHVEWKDVWLGAGFTAILFVIGKFLLGLYLGRASVSSGYGAAGSLIVLLLWVYWSSQILFFGAEFTQVYACKHGSRIGDTSKADARRSTAAAATTAQQPTEEVAKRPKLLPAYAKTSESGGGKKGGGLKLALGGIAGMFVGALVGSIGAVMMVLKLVKRLVTFH